MFETWKRTGRVAALCAWAVASNCVASWAITDAPFDVKVEEIRYDGLKDQFQWLKVTYCIEKTSSAPIEAMFSDAGLIAQLTAYRIDRLLVRCDGRFRQGNCGQMSMSLGDMRAGERRCFSANVPLSSELADARVVFSPAIYPSDTAVICRENILPLASDFRTWCSSDIVKPSPTRAFRKSGRTPYDFQVR